MNTAAMNSELVANPRIGNHPQKTMNQATHIIFTPIGKPFPKTDPLPLQYTTRLIDHPAFTVFAEHVEESPLVAPLITAATTEETLPDLPELDPSSPEIAPFLLSARQQRVAEGEPSLKEVGRDFNDLPTEVALLKATGS